MRWNYLIALLLYPLCTFADNHLNSQVFFDTDKEQPLADNTIERSISNNERILLKETSSQRSTDYPTQIVRLSHDIASPQLTCAQVNEEIDRMFINKITKDKFTYTTYISCTYDPETKMATKFKISSYFDPLNDQAVAYLKTYLDEYNGSDLLGAAFNIESAKALIVSLSLSVGTKKNPNVPPFIEYREDHSSFYFKSNYELQTNLIAEVWEQFFTDEPDTILPFLDKWIFAHAGMLYKAILRDSNYALLEPERIFIMETGEPIFISPIKYYYAHVCSKYEHNHCLKQEL